jgi:uncharacterized protein (TIGR02246 family)
MRISRAVIGVAVGLLALTGGLRAGEEPSADEAALRGSGPAWAAAYNAGNAGELTDKYWDDAVLMPPGAPMAKGRDAIHEYFVAGVAGTKAAGLTMHIPEADAVGVSGDLAWDAGVYSVTDASGATIDTGKYLAVYQKRNGEWRYLRDTWNSDFPPPSAE